MADREKVIKGLKCCAHIDGVECKNCPYDNKDEDCTALMLMDALELIDTQYKLIRELQNLISAGTKMLKGR